MKGYRTLLFNLASLLVMVAGAALLYVDKLPMSDGQAAMFGFAATIVVNVCNFYLRSVTTAPIGEKQ
jgi:hypothetical protein